MSVEVEAAPEETNLQGWLKNARVPAHCLANLSSFFFFTSPSVNGIIMCICYLQYLWEDIYLLCRSRKEGAG